MSSPDQYPPPPRQEDLTPSGSGGIGCLSIGALSVLLLFVSVIGLCAGHSVGVGLVFFWLAVATFGLALIVGLLGLLSYLIRR